MDEKFENEFEKLFLALEIILPKSTLADFANVAEDGLWEFHFTIGLFLRNNFISPGNAVNQLFNELGIFLADDMSDIIISRFHKFLKRL